MGFDKWYREVGYLGDDQNTRAKIAYEAGAASRQAEIDELKEIVGDQLIRIGQLEQTQKELQKRVDDALKALEKLDGYDYNENLDAVFLILKGEQAGY